MRYDRFGRILCETQDEALEYAVKMADASPCRSKRGVVIWGHGGIPEDNRKVVFAAEFNRQPEGFICDGSDRCKQDCGHTAIHAEQAAILTALGRGFKLRGSQMLHVKTVDGKAVPSHAPSCLQCSKLIVESGISAMWLLHAKDYAVPMGQLYSHTSEGILVCRSANEFHRATAEDFHGIQLLEKREEAA